MKLIESPSASHLRTHVYAAAGMKCSIERNKNNGSGAQVYVCIRGLYPRKMKKRHIVMPCVFKGGVCPSRGLEQKKCMKKLGMNLRGPDHGKGRTCSQLGPSSLATFNADSQS